MATIINTSPQSDEGTGWAVFLGVITLILIAFFLFAYGLPALRVAPEPDPAAIENNIDLNLPPTQVQ